MGWSKSRSWMKKLCPWSLLNLIPIPQSKLDSRKNAFLWMALTQRYGARNKTCRSKVISHLISIGFNWQVQPCKKNSSPTWNGSVDGITWASWDVYIHTCHTLIAHFNLYAFSDHDARGTASWQYMCIIHRPFTLAQIAILSSTSPSSKPLALPLRRNTSKPLAPC